ncbi:MAG: hypothetical protein KIS73_19565 [Enhydrobacter sp.]|nr:hypothetical protein [Enhydrobacter sp.]
MTGVDSSAARYQVQTEERDCSLTVCGEPYSRKSEAARIARHLAKNAALGARNFLVFDNRTELFVFTAKVKPLATHRAPSAVVEAALAA